MTDRPDPWDIDALYRIVSIDKLPNGRYVVYDDGSEPLEDPVTEESWFRTEWEARLAMWRWWKRGRQ
jgi:hypothetical protein